MEVKFGRENIGTIEWEADHWGVNISLDCKIPCDPMPLLRCYGKTENGFLLIGLPEPRGGRLYLKRHLSNEFLRSAGCIDVMPSAFLLSTEPEEKEEKDDSGAREEQKDDSGAKAEQKEKIEEKAEEPEDPKDPSFFIQKPLIRTGDSVLDELIEDERVTAAWDGDDIVLSCPFSSNQPFMLAPAFVLCEVRGGQAVLRFAKKDTAEPAVPEEVT